MLRSLGNDFLSSFKRIPMLVGTNPVRSKWTIKGSEINDDPVKCHLWKSYNEKVYPPQTPDEKQRPGFVCHVKEDIRYSYKRMWYLACLVRGMSIDEALKQLQFVKKKGAEIARETLLEAQEMAVNEHNIEFKTNLWVSESFVGKSYRLKGKRRCARGRLTNIHYDYIHYFVTLEEGTPPEYYYYNKKNQTLKEMYDKWLDDMRNRKVIECL
ncbi:UNVERIFIED_CONTAM: hypothetical protein PYX00_010760 [Menopon gallinae]|uniref:Large ribosomal subunit protein uL22m n=1 Tax=Menopon gallinae TaxID=328185 RepID=A0AAW2HHM4_9NEOP